MYFSVSSSLVHFVLLKWSSYIQCSDNLLTHGLQFVALDDGVYGAHTLRCHWRQSIWLIHSVIKGKGVYEAVVSTLGGYTLWVAPLFSKAFVVTYRKNIHVTEGGATMKLFCHNRSRHTVLKIVDAGRKWHRVPHQPPPPCPPPPVCNCKQKNMGELNFCIRRSRSQTPST